MEWRIREGFGPPVTYWSEDVNDNTPSTSSNSMTCSATFVSIDPLPVVSGTQASYGPTSGAITCNVWSCGRILRAGRRKLFSSLDYLSIGRVHHEWAARNRCEPHMEHWLTGVICRTSRACSPVSDPYHRPVRVRK